MSLGCLLCIIYPVQDPSLLQASENDMTAKKMASIVDDLKPVLNRALKYDIALVIEDLLSSLMSIC